MKLSEDIQTLDSLLAAQKPTDKNETQEVDDESDPFKVSKVPINSLLFSKIKQQAKFDNLNNKYEASIPDELLQILQDSDNFKSKIDAQFYDSQQLIQRRAKRIREKNDDVSETGPTRSLQRAVFAIPHSLKKQNQELNNQAIPSSKTISSNKQSKQHKKSDEKKWDDLFKMDISHQLEILPQVLYHYKYYEEIVNQNKDHQMKLNQLMSHIESKLKTETHSGSQNHQKVSEVRTGIVAKCETALEDLLHFALKPEMQKQFPTIKQQLLSHQLVQVPSLPYQTINGLASLGQILGQIVNLPVTRSEETGRVIDDSDLDQYQRVVDDVQQKVRKNGIIKLDGIEKVPIAQRANILLLFPRLEQQSGAIQQEFIRLINSLINDCFKKSRSPGIYDISHAQLLYFAARVQEFYESNNDLVTIFRNKLSETLLSYHLTKEQNFLLLKVMANDKAVLNGPNGLNDIQFFQGGVKGARYDPFNEKMMQKVEELDVKIASIDFSLLEQMCLRLAITLTHVGSVEDAKKLLYFFDYMQTTTPAFMFPDKDKFILRRMVVSLNQLMERKTFSINLPLQALAVLGYQAFRSDEHFNYFTQIALKDPQAIKRDADRNLLERTCEVQVTRANAKMYFFDHNKRTAMTLKGLGNQAQSYYDESLIALNRIVKDLVSSSFPVSPQTEAKDLQIVTNILAQPHISLRIFTSFKEAQETTSHLFKMMEKHLKEVPFKKHKDQLVALRNLTNQFATLRNLKYFIKFPNELEVQSAQIAKQRMHELADHLKEFKHTSEGDFPLAELLSTNAAILNYIDQLSNEKLQQGLMNTYMQTLDIIPMVSKLLAKVLGKDHQTQSHSSSQVDKAISNATWSEVQKMHESLLAHFVTLLRFKNKSTTNARMQQLMNMEDLCTDYILKLKNCRTLHNEHLINLIQLISYLPQRTPSTFDPILLSIIPILNATDRIKKELRLKIGATVPKYKHKSANTPTGLLTKEVENEIPIYYKRVFDQEMLEKPYQPIEIAPVIIKEFELINDQEIERIKNIENILLRLIFNLHKRMENRNTIECSLNSVTRIFASNFDKLNIEDHISGLQILGSNINNYNEYLINKLYDTYSCTDKLSKLFLENQSTFFRLAYSWPTFLKNTIILNVITSNTASLVQQPVLEQCETLKVLTDKKILHPELIDSFFKKFMPLTDRDQVKKYVEQLITSMATLGYTGDVNLQALTSVFRRLYKEPSQVDTRQLLNFFISLAIGRPNLEEFDSKNRAFITSALDVLEGKFMGANTTTVLRYVPDSLDSKKENKVPETPHLSETDGFAEKFSMFYFNSISSKAEMFKKNLSNMQQMEDKIALEKSPYMEKYREYINANKFDKEEDEQIAESQDLIDEIPQNVLPEKTEETKEEKIKSYERGANDRGPNEEKALAQLFLNRSNNMSKRGRHMFLFNNTNYSMSQDLNENEIAKAWAVLYHFRNKATESMLFEEFNAIAQRIAAYKAQLHNLFGKFYYTLVEHYANAGVQLNLQKSCPQTGWPQDIQIITNPALRNQITPISQKYAIYFLLKSELCYNMKKDFRMEPLGLQKLMQMHFSNFGDFKVMFVTEDEAFRDLEGVIEQVKQVVKVKSNSLRELLNEEEEAKRRTAERAAEGEIDEELL